MGFVGLLPPSATRPKSAFLAGRAGIHNIVRDQFSIQTWLAAGALAQGCLILLVGRLALLPAAAYIFYSIADAYLTAIGLKANPLMSDVLMTKFTAQIPDARGDFSGEPAGSDVVVFLIGTRNNHPLGVLAPGYREMGEYMMNMAKELDARADEFGFLGMTSWIANGQRETRNEFLEVCYFRSVEGLLKFAHSELHRKGWSWYSSQVKKLPHLSIYHETYHVPKGHWETIYQNTHPSHLASTTYKYTDERSGEEKWASPIVDATRGTLKTSAGRMGKGKGDVHEPFTV